MSLAPDTRSVLDRLLADLAQEPNPRRRRQLLQARADLWRAEDVSRFYDEVLRLLHVNVQQAERVARAAFQIAERLGEAAPRAAGLRALGHVYYRKRKYETSLHHYQKSLEMYRGWAMSLEAGRTLNSSLQSLIYLGRYEEAMDHAREAREIFERAGDRLRLARLDANVGNILYRQDRFEEALELYQRAYETFVEIGEPQDVAISLKNTATCQISLNNFPEALATYQKARAYCLRAEMPAAGGGGRLQHRLPLLSARRIHTLHRTLSRRSQGLPQARRQVPGGVVRPRPVRDVPGAEPERGGRAPGGARAERLPGTGYGVRSRQGPNQPCDLPHPPRSAA